MNFTYKLVQKVKEKHNLNSDYAVAKLCNLTTQNMSDWKRGVSEANAEKTLRLMAAAEISAVDALLIMTQLPATSSGTLSHTSKQCILCKIT